jgi:hypothetical protein
MLTLAQARGAVHHEGTFTLLDWLPGVLAITEKAGKVNVPLV